MEEWVEKFSEQHQRKYWANKVTGKTTWTNPAPTTPSGQGTSEALKQSKESAAAPASESSEWVERYSEQHQRKYWTNKVTGKASWTAPGPAPQKSSTAAGEGAGEGGSVRSGEEEWVEKYSEQHKRKYWANKVTGKTTWTPPSLSPAAGAKNAEEEWEEKYSEKHKRRYWQSKATGKTSWVNPNGSSSTSASTVSAAPAAAGGGAGGGGGSDWIEKYSEQHKRKYWANKVTGKTTWTNPIAVSSVTSSATRADDEWTEKVSAKHNNRKYWVNKQGTTTWTDPHKNASTSNAIPATASAPATSVSTSSSVEESSTNVNQVAETTESDSTLSIQLKKLEQDRESLQQRHSELQEKLHESNQERDQLRSTVEKVTQEQEIAFEKWNQEKESLNRNYHEAKTQCQELQGECLRLVTERDIYLKLHSEDEKRRDKYDEERVRLLTHSKDENSSIPRVAETQSPQSASTPLMDIIAIQHCHEQYVRKLHAENEIKILEERAKITKEMNKLQQELLEASEKYQNLMSKHERTEKALVDMKEKYTELEMKYCQKCDEVDRVQEKNQRITSERNELQQMIEIKSNELLRYLQEEANNNNRKGVENSSRGDGESLLMMTSLTKNLLKEVQTLIESTPRQQTKWLSQEIPDDAPPLDRYLDVVYDDLEPPPPEDEDDDLPLEDPEDDDAPPDSPPPMDL